MKILYALPATGNGHISRAIELFPVLQKYGEVDFLVSGCNAQLSVPFPVKYKSKGISLFYSANGALNYYKFLQNIHISKLFTEMRELPVNNYDCVISDFEPLSAWACKINKKFCLQWGHQASFVYEETPRPKKINVAAEFIMQRYAPGNHHLGLHFEHYHENILTPVIKSSVYWANPAEKNHITVYLQQYRLKRIVETLRKIKHVDIHIFHPEVAHNFHQDNLFFFSINKDLFSESFQNCKLIITGGGFETPAEALYMRKRMICIPIKHHYEQLCNVAALKEKGAISIKTFDDNIISIIHHSLNTSTDALPVIRYPNTELLTDRMFEKWDVWRREFPNDEVVSAEMEIDFAEMEQPYYIK